MSELFFAPLIALEFSGVADLYWQAGLLAPAIAAGCGIVHESDIMLTLDQSYCNTEFLYSITSAANSFTCYLLPATCYLANT